jgi:hypothetical protein
MTRIEDVKNHSIKFDESFFAQEVKAGNLLSVEDRAQIIQLDKTASAFLWNYQSLSFPMSHGLEDTFATVQTWDRRVSTVDESRKWLQQLSVPLENQVFVLIHPNLAFIISWNMVIKYYRSVLNLNRQLIWDRSLNWCLYYYEDGENVQWSFFQNRRKQ